MFRFGFYNAIRPRPAWMLGGAQDQDPDSNFVIHYLLDGSDTQLTSFGGVTTCEGVECPEATGSCLNGVDGQYRADGDSVLFDGIQDDFTISFWIKTTGTGGVIYRVNNPSGGGNGFEFFLLNGRIAFNSNNFTQTIGQVNDGEWHFYLCSYKDGIISKYIDNVLDSSGSLTVNTWSTPPSPQVYIGTNGASFFDGSMDGIRVYSFEQTPEVREALYNHTCAP